MRKKLLLWDIDGTLMNCYRDGTLALNETFRRRTGCENACGTVIAGTLMDSAFVDKIMEEFHIPREEKTDIVDEFAVILKEIVTNNQKKRILPGIVEILDELIQRKDIYMGLITSNFKVGAEIKLRSVGLDRYFSFGGFGDHPGEKWNAAETAIKEAEKIAGTEFNRDDIYIIGDSRYDIECAKKTGVKSIAVATGWMDYDTLKKTEADYLFESFENVQSFLDIISE